MKWPLMIVLFSICSDIPVVLGLLRIAESILCPNYNRRNRSPFGVDFFPSLFPCPAQYTRIWRWKPSDFCSLRCWSNYFRLVSFIFNTFRRNDLLPAPVSTAAVSASTHVRVRSVRSRVCDVFEKKRENHRKS